MLTVLFIINYQSVLYAGNLDQFIRDRVQETDKGFLDSSMSIITYLGHAGVNLGIASLLTEEEIRREATQAILVSGGMALMLKYIIGQKRPPGPVEYRPFTFDDNFFSMPSGHTATAFALATVIANNYSEQKVMAYSLASLVAISRLYEDKHWFSNIVLGAIVGHYSAKFVIEKW